MNAEQAATLRAPFAAEAVGKLPRSTCKKCSDSREKHCDQHQRTKCQVCGNYITTAHIHLDYVGHAAVTDRLLKVDPACTWRFMASNADGSPVVVKEGLSDPVAKVGIWIELLLCDTATPGFGEGKGFKDAIGDAIRNAAMRRGVALDLWAKEDLHAAQGAEERAREAAEEKAKADADRHALTDRIVALAVAKGADETDLRAKIAGHHGKNSSEDHAAWLAKLLAAATESAGEPGRGTGVVEAAPSPAADSTGPATSPPVESLGDSGPGGASPSPATTFQQPRSVPKQKPPTAKMVTLLNILVDRLTTTGRVTKPELWVMAGKRPDDAEEAEHFSGLRKQLTLAEASQLIDQLTAMEEFAIADGVLEPRKQAA